MDWKKIAPWNWFKDEESAIPIARARPPGGRMDLPAAMQRLLGDADLPLRPSVDISEGKKAYTVRAELPGVEPDDISVEVEGRTLVLRAEKRHESEEEDEGYHCIESSYGAVQRVLSLPQDADPESIDAHFKNGVLKLRVQKHAARSTSARNI